MSAAPHLFSDPPISSPELALVDADLAAQLRADLSSGEAFRPRQAARPTYLSLVFDAAAPEPAEVEPPADEEPAELSAGVVDLLPAYVVLPDGTAEEIVLDAEDSEAAEMSDHIELATPDLTSDELPDYVVQRVDEPAPDPAPSIDPALAAVDEQRHELPDDIVQVDVDTAVDVLVDHLVVPEAEVVTVSEHIVPVRDEIEDVLPEYVVSGLGEVADDVVPDETPAMSDYPVLPDLDERREALEETEAALARIREQLVVPADVPKPRGRRRFAILSGLGVAAALAVVAVDVQLGLLHAPGWLAF